LEERLKRVVDISVRTAMLVAVFLTVITPFAAQTECAMACETACPSTSMSMEAPSSHTDCCAPGHATTMSSGCDHSTEKPAGAVASAPDKAAASAVAVSAFALPAPDQAVIAGPLVGVAAPPPDTLSGTRLRI
jgi:hypothetical protein